ncbi:uncharacterized protein LOC131855806 isoform X3 [Cryptomeria japonica]|uniref:uncharacterized protein LOC131855806 isoform X3 n=1 Tax=Cryptomeria japonica TaxID=3369 RepID=UPI0027DA507F|nr:uncharacterized protein LOC131855806 isoform X3 [Cryptomeria japonica]
MGGLSLWFTGVETMADLKEVVNSVLLPLQLSLGLLLIMKTTPLWAVIHCTLAYLLHCLCFPYTDYKQLGEFQGRVFKKVISHATTAGDVSKLKNQKDAQESKKEGKSQIDDTVSVVYLGKKFVLKRMEGNKMLMKDGPGYCITDKMWETVKYIEKMASNTVFVKNHKEIWEEVVTGDIMKFEEVLNSVILDNRAVIRLDHDYFLPVNLLLSEDKLMTILNFVGLFLKTQKHIHWLIPASLTFASVSMGFSTKVRLWIDGFINAILCRSVQLLCDPLPLAMRRRAYCWGNWVENLKPGNDLQSKIVSGKVCLLVAAGAKADSEFFADCESLASRGGGAKAHLGTSTECESSADLVIMADQNYIRALLPGGGRRI